MKPKKKCNFCELQSLHHYCPNIRIPCGIETAARTTAVFPPNKTITVTIRTNYTPTCCVVVVIVVVVIIIISLDLIYNEFVTGAAARPVRQFVAFGLCTCDEPVFQVIMQMAVDAQQKAL